MSVDTEISKSSLIRCPKCKRDSRRIEVELSKIDWCLVFVIGLWAAVMFPPNRRKGFQCEHCGKIFLPKAQAVSKSLLWVSVLCSLFAVLVIVLLVVILHSHHG